MGLRIASRRTRRPPQAGGLPHWLRELSRETPGEAGHLVWQESLARTVVLTDRYDLLGFGPKIAHQRDSIVLVASQDGRFTIFEWSSCDDALHAHRVEALLL